MIDVTKTRAALEDAIGVYKNLALRHPEDADQLNEVLRYLDLLSAALGQAQEAWQSTERAQVAAWTSKPESHCYRVLILHADATADEVTK